MGLRAVPRDLKSKQSYQAPLWNQLSVLERDAPSSIKIWLQTFLSDKAYHWSFIKNEGRRFDPEPSIRYGNIGSVCLGTPVC